MPHIWLQKMVHEPRKGTYGHSAVLGDLPKLAANFPYHTIPNHTDPITPDRQLAVPEMHDKPRKGDWSPQAHLRRQ